MCSARREISEPKLSAKERKLFALLPSNGVSVSSADLIERFYAGEERPFNAREIIIDRMNTIIRKFALHPNAVIRIHKSKRRGPHPIEYWVTRLKPSGK